MGTRNWFDIIPPHEDIRKGHFDEAIFAADLGDVAARTAPPDYNDPYLFYKKTFAADLTQGGVEDFIPRGLYLDQVNIDIGMSGLDFSLDPFALFEGQFTCPCAYSKDHIRS